MLTSTSLIFLVRPTTAMLMKIGSQKTTSFRATLRTMRMKGTAEDHHQALLNDLGPQIDVPCGSGNVLDLPNALDLDVQERADFREFFCEIRGGH